MRKTLSSSPKQETPTEMSNHKPLSSQSSWFLSSVVRVWVIQKRVMLLPLSHFCWSITLPFLYTTEKFYKMGNDQWKQRKGGRGSEEKICVWLWNPADFFSSMCFIFSVHSIRDHTHKNKLNDNTLISIWLNVLYLETEAI